MGGGLVTAPALGIVELGDVCARQRALSLDLFRELGAWVTADDGNVAGEERRRYSTACHRHAWHAQLWAERSPAIPSVDLDAAVGDASRSRLPDRPSAKAYRSLLDEMIADLERLTQRIDADLDPATRRVLTLVRHDLVELRDPTSTRRA